MFMPPHCRLGLLFSWGMAEGLTDAEIINRIGTIYLLLSVVKYSLFVGFFIVKRNKFYLTTLFVIKEVEGNVRGWSKDLLYQGIASTAQTGQVFMMTALANQINADVPIAANIIQNTIKTVTLPSVVAASFVVYIGSRFVGDSRFAMFWGLKRGVLAFNVFATILSVVIFKAALAAASGALMNDGGSKGVNNELHINCLIGLSPCAQNPSLCNSEHVRNDNPSTLTTMVLSLLCVIFSGWQAVLMNVFIALNAFYEILLAVVIPFVFIFVPGSLISTLAFSPMSGISGGQCIISNTTHYYKPTSPGYGAPLSTGSSTGDGNWSLLISMNLTFTVVGQFICFYFLYHYKLRPEEREREAQSIVNMTEVAANEDGGKKFYDLATALGLSLSDEIEVDPNFSRRLSSCSASGALSVPASQSDSQEAFIGSRSAPF